mmetsp:Transcript_14037/g.28110  ORF Transcript_14037/g.28110 Transcript_14037/m.28110 type:complete len:146 (-) Transcript_14037:351-788(-)
MEKRKRGRRKGKKNGDESEADGEEKRRQEKAKRMKRHVATPGMPVSHLPGGRPKEGREISSYCVLVASSRKRIGADRKRDRRHQRTKKGWFLHAGCFLIVFFAVWLVGFKISAVFSFVFRFSFSLPFSCSHVSLLPSPHPPLNYT